MTKTTDSLKEEIKELLSDNGDLKTGKIKEYLDIYERLTSYEIKSLHETTTLATRDNIGGFGIANNDFGYARARAQPIIAHNAIGNETNIMIDSMLRLSGLADEYIKSQCSDIKTKNIDRYIGWIEYLDKYSCSENSKNIKDELNNLIIKEITNQIDKQLKEEDI